MSAWIVSQAHIDVLVQALCEGEIVTAIDPDEVGQRLWEENYRSINARYREDNHAPEYHYRRPAKKIVPSGVLYAAGCYDYQSCEHNAYYDSEPCKWVGELNDMLRHHPDVEVNPPFGKYPWGYDEGDVH
jgi:hypothetical protein